MMFDAKAGAGSRVPLGVPPCSMTQLGVVQVSQCRNYFRCCFWDLAPREHATVNQKGIYGEVISGFFRNVDSRLS